MKKLILILLFTTSVFAQSHLLLLLDSGVSYQTETLDWVARVEANGGAVDKTTIQAIDAFIIAIAPIRTSIKRFNPFAGNNLNAALVPLIKDWGGTIDTNVNFVDADYIANVGLGKSANTNRYLKSGIIPSSTIGYSVTSTHLMSYSKTSAGTNFSMGVYSTDFLCLYPKDASGRLQYFVNGQGAAKAGETYFSGMTLANRNANNYTEAVRNDTTISSVTTTGGAAPTKELLIFANNNNGTINNFSPTYLGCYSVGLGLSASNRTLYYNAVYNLMKALGRNAF